MDKDKIKQYVSQIGGLLGLLYLALQSSGIEVPLLNPEHVQPWINFLMVLVPGAFTLYGVYKNSYLIKPKAKMQEEYLKEKGLK